MYIYYKCSQVLTYLTDNNKSSFRSGQSNIDLMLIRYKSQVLFKPPAVRLVVYLGVW